MAKIKKMMKNEWSPDSWRELPIKQQPTWPDTEKLKKVTDELSSLPPLVAASEIEKLKEQLALASEGKAFLLQGGDCAESFDEFSTDNLRAYFRVMLQMTVGLMYGAGVPVVKVGRIAGQFAKPRSADIEELDGISLPSYRGDLVNTQDFTETARIPNPENMLRVYHQSTSTLNFLRQLAKGGYASLSKVSEWNKEFLDNSPQSKRFEDMVRGIEDAMSFIEACGLPLNDIRRLREADFYISHEGLVLEYEQPFTRLDEETGKFYDLSAHMLWIGDRTRTLDEAHIEFFRGVGNPIGCKVGPSMKPDELVELISILNPDNEAGKLTLIARFGASNVDKMLPPLVRAVRDAGKKVVWSCDPMHGNTQKAPNNYKTRPFNDILSELRSFFTIHKAEGTNAGGVHFEMTGQDVTECTGGAQAISEVDLSNRYHTHCDPRMNASQSLEMAFLIGEELKGE
jgi:3-deoxy-7-phosphoheptulonate synthase